MPHSVCDTDHHTKRSTDLENITQLCDSFPGIVIERRVPKLARKLENEPGNYFAVLQGEVEETVERVPASGDITRHYADVEAILLAVALPYGQEDGR